jgi:hypothetical protein
MNIPIFIAILKLIEMYLLIVFLNFINSEVSFFLLIIYFISTFIFLLACSVLDIRLRQFEFRRRKL